MGAESVDPRISELRKLRERRGMVPGRTLVCQTIIDELNITPAELHKRIVARLNDRGNDHYAAALKAAYGLDPRYKGNTVTERREVFGGAQSPPIVPETVETWENRAIEELLSHLLHGSPEVENVNISFRGVFKSDTWIEYQESIQSGERPAPYKIASNYHESRNIDVVPHLPVPELIYQVPIIEFPISMLMLNIEYWDNWVETGYQPWMSSGGDFTALRENARLGVHQVKDRGSYTRLSAYFRDPIPGHFYALGWLPRATGA